MKYTVGCVLISNRNKDPDLETLEQFKVQSQPLGPAAGTRQWVRSGSPMEEAPIRTSSHPTEVPKSCCQNTSVEIQEKEVQ